MSLAMTAVMVQWVLLMPFRWRELGWVADDILSLIFQLWVSVDLGENWRKLSDSVVANHYYWRRMEKMDGLGTVYFEKNISSELS